MQTGVVSALLLGTSSLFWTHGEVAYPYAFLALFSTLVLLLLTETKFGPHNLIVPAAFVLGLGAGFPSGSVAIPLTRVGLRLVGEEFAEVSSSALE